MVLGTRSATKFEQVPSTSMFGLMGFVGLVDLLGLVGLGVPGYFQMEVWSVMIKKQLMIPKSLMSLPMKVMKSKSLR